MFGRIDYVEIINCFWYWATKFMWLKILNRGIKNRIIISDYSELKFKQFYFSKI